jgi:LPS sulfotransferase NodH/2-polyprenyl-3-methyl-5-hydroxy-6-metoxy-1,4-benzoquinol methylase
MAEQMSNTKKLIVDERSNRILSDERLDYNHFKPLRKSYIVAASYRSGSTHLCRLLWQTGRLGAPTEVLNPTRQFYFLMTRLRASSPADYIAKLVARRTSINGIFGLKAHFRHFQLFLSDYPRLLEALSPVTYIHIYRQDKIAQAVSAAKAWQTDQWASPSKERPKPPLRYDREMIANCLQDAEQQELDWRRWFAAHNITPLQVTYEQCNADAAGVVRGIVELLGVQNDERDEVNIPPIEKQADETSQEWIERFRRETRAGGLSVESPRTSLKDHFLVKTAGSVPSCSEAQFFDRYTRLIESLWEGPRPDPRFIEAIRLRRRYDAIIGQNQHLFKNARVLDIVSSEGFWGLAVLEAGAAQVVGLEPSRKLVKAAEKSFSEYEIKSDLYRFITSDILVALRNLEPERFDVILCKESFEDCHLPEFFGQLSRLRPKHVILDTKITRGFGPLARFEISMKDKTARVTSVPNHEAIEFLCEPHFSWRLIDWQAMGIADWTGIHDYARDVRRTYVLSTHDAVA